MFTDNANQLVNSKIEIQTPKKLVYYTTHTHKSFNNLSQEEWVSNAPPVAPYALSPWMQPEIAIISYSKQREAKSNKRKK